MNPNLDPFVVTAKERLRFQDQFNALGPVNGIVTGAQAKGFLLKSQLSPLVLGQIWALADTDADGKMNLRNIEVPKMLPPTLLASLKHVGTPIRTPTGTMSPVEGYKQFLPPVANVPPQQQQQQPIMAQQQPMMMTQAPLPQMPTMPVMPMTSQAIAGGVVQTVSPQQQISPEMLMQQHQQMMMMAQQQQQQLPPQQIIPASIPTGTILPTQPAMMMSNNIPISAVVPPPAKPPLVDQLSNSSLLDSLAQVQPLPIATSALPAAPTPTPPQSGHASRSMSFSEKAPSVPESPSSEWAVPQSSKLKFTQLFNATDKTRSGFLTGTQARGILLQTKVPQAELARIWALSDRDADGRLGCEEFVLALYLCEMYMTGKQIPVELPADLIPPSFRKIPSRHGSVVNSRHGSVSSQGAVSAHDIDAAAGMSQSSFEDKRKENYDKGQAELERRRKALADMQRKEQEERERKERDEADKREKARLEAELKKQQEIERELQRQKELEEEKEEQRNRELEKKEQARKEAEKQRQLEWEAQKLQEMEQERQKEQDRLLKLKGQNQTLTIELESLDTKVKELSQKICDTRVAVTNVKTVIDGMRSTRDTCVSEQTTLKAQIKEQNAKLVMLSQEKARIDAKGKVNSTADDQAVFTNKQIIIKQLKDKVGNIKAEIEEKSSDITTHKEQKKEARDELNELITNCEQLYNDYDVVRIQVLELKNNRKNDSYSSAWPTTTTTSSTAATMNSAWPVEEKEAPEPVDTSRDVAPDGYVRYRAVYEFYARNEDEVTFQPGDIIMVPLEQNGEAGWLAGEISGHTGWFPESYAEKININDPEPSRVSAEVAAVVEPEITKTETTNIEATNLSGERYVACYPYQSAEAGDLVFEAGEEVLVVKKDGDWWTGVIGNRSGIFPANYVQPADNTSMSTTTTTTTSSNISEMNNNLSNMNINGTDQTVNNTNSSMSAEEARNQADADSEVSQINTQNVTNDASMQEFRGMTASASLRAKKGEVATVIAPYEATSSEQLSLQKGQLIMIRKKTDSGWWEGELQTKGRRRQVGWFPATYVKVLAGGRMSGRSTPLSSSKINLHETVIDKVQAMYPYKAQNDDELNFEPDDIISVLSRDEPDWWRGELNGITGLFPSNYVRTFVSSGKI
ncbi:CLUMA_CG016510, isoform A [Clunio marinus]|uniref:CLUMA_CG016510, isoform A n=1 Tax=Clunio marinus TaxID=568069 RepID=A0A1J1ITK8_9DIPT|nr:CLUMA_CG016510, isoform A [Clunio marinus]